MDVVSDKELLLRAHMLKEGVEWLMGQILSLKYLLKVIDVNICIHNGMKLSLFLLNNSKFDLLLRHL